jgi:hypothetical protein
MTSFAQSSFCGDFHPQDLNEHSGGWLFAFLKADGVGIPL